MPAPILPSQADAMAGNARDTFFALLATYLSQATQDIPNDFSKVPVDADGNRTFTFQGVTYKVAKRATNDVFLMPGVNVYFGDDTVTHWKAQPRRWVLPVFVHVLVPWTERPTIAEKVAFRLSEQCMQAIEGLGGRIQVYDFSTGSPTPVAGRFLSWAVAPQPAWVFRELSQPHKDLNTNRMGSIEIRYAR